MGSEKLKAWNPRISIRTKLLTSFLLFLALLGKRNGRRSREKFQSTHSQGVRQQKMTVFSSKVLKPLPIILTFYLLLY
jgi:hypothetical protein